MTFGYDIIRHCFARRLRCYHVVSPFAAFHISHFVDIIAVIVISSTESATWRYTRGDEQAREVTRHYIDILLLRHFGMMLRHASAEMKKMSAKRAIIICRR